jgi:hypothetical protein
MSSSARNLAGSSSSSAAARGGGRTGGRKRRLEQSGDGEQKDDNQQNHNDQQQHSDSKEEKSSSSSSQQTASFDGSSPPNLPAVSVTVPHVAVSAKPKKLTKSGQVSTAGEPLLTQPEALAVLELRYGDEKRRALFSSNNPRVQHRAWEELTAELEERWGIRRTHKQLYDLIHDKTATYWNRCKVAEESGMQALKPWPFHAALQGAAVSSSSSSGASSSSSSSHAARQGDVGAMPVLPSLPPTAEQLMKEVDVTRRILHKVIAAIGPAIRPYNEMYDEAVKEHAAALAAPLPRQQAGREAAARRG